MVILTEAAARKCFQWRRLFLIVLGLHATVGVGSGCRHSGSSPIIERGAVASPEPLASEMGARILREGGNAIDAGVAVHFALAVTYPSAGNLGGGGFMIVHTQEGEVAIDYRETAPAAAHRDMYLDERGNVIPSMSLHTVHSVGVPGSVAGMWLAHRKFGSLPWKRLLEPAIRLAEEGWPLDSWTAQSFTRQSLHNTQDYFKGRTGKIFVQKELAATLRRIAERGRDEFYRGETARLLVAEMKRRGGLIT